VGRHVRCRLGDGWFLSDTGNDSVVLIDRMLHWRRNSPAAAGDWELQIRFACSCRALAVTVGPSDPHHHQDEALGGESASNSPAGDALSDSGAALGAELRVSRRAQSAIWPS
jgi:hypothetical protein